MFLLRTCLSLLTIWMQIYLLCPVVLASGVDSDFTEQYTSITKQLLLKGVELERFSLHYRLEALKQPKFRQLRYFLTQEAGASCVLGFEISALHQFGIGKHHPLKVSPNALRGATATAMTGAIIAGAGSCLELGSNAWRAIENKRHGFDPKSAKQFVMSRLKEIDDLLAQREALVATHQDNPGYERGVVEGKILHELRQAFVIEFANFYGDAKSYAAFTNTFFLLNAATTAIGATAAGLAYRSVSDAKLTGPANILFIVTGGIAMASPLLSTAAGAFMRQHSYDSVIDQMGQNESFDASRLTANRKILEQLLPDSQASLMPSLPGTQRLALYTESDQLFQKQLQNETKILHQLEKVAIQSNILGPVIAGTLMTQGILGTVGYYKYTIRPRKQLNCFYNGAVVGTTGASLAVVGTAAALLASWSYQNHLRKHNQLPEQLIKQRLDHIDEVERLVLAL